MICLAEIGTRIIDEAEGRLALECLCELGSRERPIVQLVSFN